MQRDHPDLVSRNDAVDRVLSLRNAFLAERDIITVSLDNISGYVLAEDIIATSDNPPHSYATMDGYAFDATQEYPFTIVDRSVFPEDEPDPIAPDEAIPISTGAPLPPGANAVLKREDATVAEGTLSGISLAPGNYTYEQGSNIQKGERLFQAGERLSPKDALLLGDLGYDTISVYQPFSVALLATGTEIHEGRMRDLDSPMLAGLIRSWGHTVTFEGTVPDDEQTVTDRIDELASTYDVVVTTGGTSVGKKDYVLNALSSLGSIDFHRVTIRPGKPIAFATLAEHDSVGIAIPGKPVGAHIVTILVARPFFCGPAALPTISATMERRIDLGTSGFEYVIPVTLEADTAMPLGHVDSSLSVYQETFNPSVLSSSTRASRADGFVITESPIDEGEAVEVTPYIALE